MSWRVRFFQTQRGDYPVKEFIGQQDKATHAKSIHAIMLLGNNGPFLRPPYIKKLQNKLYELRISGRVSIRIFYTIVNDEYYLLHAFKKKTQKIPSRELKIALDRIPGLI
jgi:phage-related protein